MPLYEYKCTCGTKTEALKRIADRHNVALCECGGRPELQISAWGRVLIAGTFTVVGHDGKVLLTRQSTDYTPMVSERGL